MIGQNNPPNCPIDWAGLSEIQDALLARTVGNGIEIARVYHYHHSEYLFQMGRELDRSSIF